MTFLYLIAATDIHNGIGKNNTLPWYLPPDLKYFHQMTSNHIVIMGRRTWESIPEKYRPLKNRYNVIISSILNLSVPTYPTLSDALDSIENTKKKVFIIGGEMLYQEAIKHSNCEEIYITKIYHNYDCDRFFPKIDENIYKKSNESEILSYDNIQYQYITYTKNHSS